MLRTVKNIILITIMTTVLLISGCSAKPAFQTPTPLAPIVITDGLNRQVTLTAPAQRVVSLAPSNTEMLFAIGAGGQVVGRDEFSNYPEEATLLPSIGGSFTDYNYEAIVSLLPDLVLAAEINTPEQVQSLEELGLTVFWVPNPKTLDDMYNTLLILSKLTGHDLTTQDLVTGLQSRVKAIEQKIATIDQHPKVFYELDSTNPNAPWTAGDGSFINTLIILAGGENIASKLEGEYLQISIEEILVHDPDIILLGDSLYGVTPESVLERPGWQELTAVKQKRVYPFDDNLVSRPGPRLVDGLEALAALFHPDIFK